MAATKIPGFTELADTWNSASPLPWDPVVDRQSVAEAVVYLVGQYSKKISGQVLYCDGGASVVGGPLLPHERVANS